MERYNKGESAPVSFKIPVCDKVIATELSEDFTLPDYQPEIRRLLRVGATLPPPARYISESGAEFSGDAHFDVLYAGADGQLYTTRLSSEYEFEVPFEAGYDAEGVVVLADVVPDTVVSRVMAPRRIGIRARLRAYVRCYADYRHEERIRGIDNPETLRRLTDTGMYALVLRGTDEAIPMNDEVIPEQGEGEIRVVGASGNVFVSEATATSGGVVCRGDLILKLMLCRDEREAVPEIITRKLPFTHEIEINGVSPGWDCRAWGTCTDITITVGEGRLMCEALMALTAEAQKNESFEYTKDIYSTAADGEVAFKEVALPVCLRCMNGNFTQNGVFDAKENNLPAGARIIDAEGSASMGGMTNEKGRCVMTGEVRYSVIFIDGSEWGSRELTQPFKYEFDAPQGSPDGSAILNVIGCRARMDGERVAVDSEVSAAVRVLSPRAYRMVSDANFTGAVHRDRGEWIICYPDEGDTLWSISKKYHADADRVAAANSIKPTGSPDRADSLAGAKYIIL
jgi:hypothetical protein